MIGQVSMFELDCMKSMQEEIPVLLLPWQTVYLVNKGDVQEAEVYGEEPSWLCREDENGIKTDRGYRLKIKGACYGCTWNSHIGVDCFTAIPPAQEKAGEFLRGHDVILARDIKTISTVAYQYIRDVDSRTMTAFFCELENGLYYIKEFMTFHHIMDKYGIKKFMEQQEFKYCKLEQIEYQPVFKNMYPCRKDVDWMYASAEYSGCI